MSGRNDKIKGFFVATCFKKFTAWSDANNNNNNNQTAQAMQCPASITNVDQIPTHLRYLLYLAHQAFPQILTSNYIEGVPETAGTKKQIAEFEKQQQLQQEKQQQQQKNEQESENVPPPTSTSTNTESASSTSIMMIPPKKKTVKACLGTFVRECVSKMHGSSLVILTRNHLKLLAIICGLAENPFSPASNEEEQEDSSSILSTFETAFKAMKVPQVMAFDSYYDEVNPPKTREEERLEREAIQAEIDRREWEAFEEAARLAKERQQARADAKAEKQRLEQEQKRQELELKRQEKEKKKAEKAAAKLLRQQQREALLRQQQQQQQQSLPLRRNRFTNNDDDGDDEEGYYNNDDDEDNEDSNQFWAGGAGANNNNNARRNNNTRVRASLNNPNLQLMNNNNIPTSSSSSSSSSDNDDDQKQQQQQQDELTVVDNNPHFRIAQRHNNGHAGIQKNTTQQENSNQNNSNDNNNEDSNLNAPTFSMALLENKIFQIICAVQTIALRDLPKEIRKTERTSNIGTGWTEADVWTCVQRLRNTGAIMFDEDVIYKL